MDDDMTTASMVTHVEMSFLIHASAHLTGLPDGSAIDTAQSEARRHCHTAFLWSISTRQSGQSAAITLIEQSKKHARDKAAPARTKLYDLMETQTTQPVAQPTHIVFNTTKRYKTSHADTAMAFWHICHPAQPFLTQLAASHITSTDPASIEGMFTRIVGPDAVSQRAAVVKKSCELLLAL